MSSLGPVAAPTSREILASYVVELASPCEEEQRRAVTELRVLSKWNASNRNTIADMGALPLLVRMLRHTDESIQQNAVTALHNLSVQGKNRERIIKVTGALDGVVSAIREGILMETRENAAALLFSLLVVPEFRVTVGNHATAIEALMELFRDGSARGKKDAVKALFHLSLCPENKPKVVAAGIIPSIVCLLLDRDAPAVVEDALALLAVLATCAEAQAVVADVGAVPVLVNELAIGSPRSKEQAASTLLVLCEHGGQSMVAEVVAEAQLMSYLNMLQARGTERGRTKANSLITFLVTYEAQ